MSIKNNRIPIINDNQGVIFDENKRPLCAYDCMERWNNGVCFYEPSQLITEEEARTIDEWAKEWGRKREKQVVVQLGLFEEVLGCHYPEKRKEYFDELRKIMHDALNRENQ